MAAKSRRSENLIALRCASCKRRTYYTNKNKKTVERKLEVVKFCKFCRKHTTQKEVKISGK